MGITVKSPLFRKLTVTDGRNCAAITEVWEGQETLTQSGTWKGEQWNTTSELGLGPPLHFTMRRNGSVVAEGRSVETEKAVLGFTSEWDVWLEDLRGRVILTPSRVGFRRVDRLTSSERILLAEGRWAFGKLTVQALHGVIRCESLIVGLFLVRSSFDPS